MTTRNEKLLTSFTEYLTAHPDERFWQALRNWSKYDIVSVIDSDSEVWRDTFYWEDMRHDASRNPNDKA